MTGRDETRAATREPRGPPPASLLPPSSVLSEGDEAVIQSSQTMVDAARNSIVRKWMRQPVTRRRLVQGASAAVAVAGLGVPGARSVARAQGDVGGTLTMMCWQGYDGPNANKPFIEQTGTVINATYLGSNDEIFAALRAGGLGEIDLVTPYHGYVKNLYEAGLLQEIDYSRLPNTNDYIPIFNKPDWNTFDGKTYAAPFVWGTGPMIYNAEFIPEAPAEWMDVMKPEYKGKVIMTDDALGHYLIWNQVTGAEDPTQVTQEQIDATTDLLIQIKTEQARAFSPNMGDMADIMARGEAWLSTIGWEAIPAFPVAEGADLRYTHPAPGDFTFVDSYCLVKDAPNVDTAYAFMDHMLSPEAQAIAMDDMDSATVNEQAIPLLDEATRALFPYDNLDEIFEIAPVWGFPPLEDQGDGIVTYNGWLETWERVRSA
jgi:putative spermidine/putrescine transport system substrate-binding protein/spermidine/putrescine transport system substrate-binding protein